MARKRSVNALVIDGVLSIMSVVGSWFGVDMFGLC